MTYAMVAGWSRDGRGGVSMIIGYWYGRRVTADTLLLKLSPARAEGFIEKGVSLPGVSLFLRYFYLH